MSSGSIRIIQLPEKSSVNTDDYMAVDSSANGTKKVKFTDLLDDNLSASNKAADAQATGEAINNISARVDNMINTQTNAEVTTLWTGQINLKNETANLSESINNFDFIDVYCGGADTVFARQHVSGSSVHFELQTQNMSDDASVQFMRWWETGLTISGTTATITKAIKCFWDDFSQHPVVSQATGGGVDIVRIDGVKIGHTDNDEIVDARVGANGTTYPTLGDAIRGQVTDLKSELSDIDYNIGTTPIPMTQGKVINLNVSTVDITALVDRAGYACAVVPCIQGDVFIVTAEGIGNYRSYAFIDSNGVKKEYAGSGVTLNRERLVAPPYSAYLIINDGSGSVSYIGETVDEQLNVVKQLKANAIKKTAGKNLFDAYSENIVDGYYVGTNGGLVANASYCVSDYISVTAGSSYAISNCYSGTAMSVAFYDKDFNVLSTVSSSPTSVTAPTNAVYMRVPVLQANRYASAQIELGTASLYLPYTDKRYSMVDLLAPAYDSTATYSTDDVVTYEGFVYKAIADIDTAETFDSTHWTRISLSQAISGSSGSDAKAIVISDNSISASGNALSANEAVELGIANVAKHIIYELVATFSSFDTIKIGHGTDSTKYASWVEIDDTNITIYANMGETPYRSSVFAHGLTIADFINVQIVTDDTYKCYVLLQTNGGHYKTTLGTFYGNCDGQSYFVATSALTSYKFRKIFVEATKPIYLFGDSYMSFASNRWVYYLKDIDQFNNVLINACGGENSERGTHALASLKGNPKYALWTYGMNDSSDADNTTPASNWLAGVTAFLAWCTQQNVTPVFGTIPTVPSKNHEAKNAYIRNSGYRYIDFAKAVGAQADGTWYSGMISDDNTHPTIEGAIALFNRAIVDFPEIMTRL